MDRPGIFQQ
ncbi:hypothetical protein CGLO_18044 [Colletotrichum gloeosporioides Cg-14]|uniref:Uncharacterized protein n=1 Tax=Colletotrichum gloeosporioides (strain Cg-14) TaxID=1237896 RepID=T0KVE7_COLGC|nr:hypothetical protein CGLO_18044 [Colletotrichum gloeosporioides Cg-14]